MPQERIERSSQLYESRSLPLTYWGPAAGRQRIELCLRDLESLWFPEPAAYVVSRPPNARKAGILSGSPAFLDDTLYGWSQEPGRLQPRLRSVIIGKGCFESILHPKTHAE